MGTPVEKFIRDAHRQHNVKYALTNDQVRRIRTKLKLADILTEVSEQDSALALDIILSDYNMGSRTLRTASATSHVANPQMRNAGMCPRCSQSMSFARLAEADEARYCANCHVCIPV